MIPKPQLNLIIPFTNKLVLGHDHLSNCVFKYYDPSDADTYRDQ